MLKIDESVNRLESLAVDFDNATTGLTQIMHEKGYLKDTEVPEGAIQTAKYAASVGILSDIETVMREAADPGNIRIAVQLAKIGDKIRICLPGGAVMSEQELEWVAQHPQETAPGNLFYQLAMDQLVDSGDLSFSYDLKAASSSFTSTLRKNLLRELGEEVGEEAANHVELGEFLDDQRETNLAAIGLPDDNLVQELALKLADRGVTLGDNCRLNGIYTRVTEKVAVGTGPLNLIEKLSTDNEEAKGMRVKPLSELAVISLQTAASIESFDNFRELHGDRHNTDGMRNPSATWGLAQVTRWLKQQVLNQDTYIDGSARESSKFD